MAITVGDVLDNMDLYCGILEVRAINSARDDYEIVSACKYLDAEVKSIRTYEGLEPKTIVTIFFKKSEILNNYRESFKNIFDGEYSDTEEEPLEKVRHTLEINNTWNKNYNNVKESNDRLISEINLGNYPKEHLKYLLSGDKVPFNKNYIYSNFLNHILQENQYNIDELTDIQWNEIYQKQGEAFLILEEKIVIDLEELISLNKNLKITLKKFLEYGKKYVRDSLGKDLKELFEEPNNIYKVELRLASSYDKLKAD